MAEASKPAVMIGQLGELWKKQPRGRKTLALLLVVGIFGGIAWTTLGSHGDTWVELAGGASPEDAHELLAKLQGDGIPARLTGTKLEVPAARADEARAIASSAGLPRTGTGYEIFNGSSLGESSFTEQVKYRRALEGELARSITSLAQIESARVHLALGKRTVFKDREEAPSASVALHLHVGQQLAPEQIGGVRALVAASIEGLKPEAVVLVDNHGNLLETGNPSSADRKADIERLVTSRVRGMLERVVGIGKVSVVTSAEIDERKVQETEEIYDKDKQALRSEARTVEGAEAIAAAAASGTNGVAGVRGNLAGGPAAVPSTTQKLSETKNYEVSRMVRQTVKPDAQLTKLHLAVVVDYKASGKTFVPRDDKELAELTALASQAAGIDVARGDKIEMRSILFAPDADAIAAAATPAASIVADLPIMWIAIGGGALVVLVTMVSLVRRRGRRNRHQAQLTTGLTLPLAARDLERMIDRARPLDALAPGQHPNEPLGLPAGRPIHERVGEAVAADVERAASVLSAWLQESAPRGAK
jgi:flagellar M-ring protein FliF